MSYNLPHGSRVTHGMNHVTRLSASALLAALALTACSSSEDDGPSDAAPSPSDTAPAQSDGGDPAADDERSAQAAADYLAAELGLTSLGEPTDNTGMCSQEAGGGEAHENDCEQLITTDQVSIYQFETPELAEHWVARMTETGEDWRQAGAYALAWSAREQALTTEERRAEFVQLMLEWATP